MAQNDFIDPGNSFDADIVNIQITCRLLRIMPRHTDDQLKGICTKSLVQCKGISSLYPLAVSQGNILIKPAGVLILDLPAALISRAIAVHIYGDLVSSAIYHHRIICRSHFVSNGASVLLCCILGSQLDADVAILCPLCRRRNRNFTIGNICTPLAVGKRVCTILKTLKQQRIGVVFLAAIIGLGSILNLDDLDVVYEHVCVGSGVVAGAEAEQHIALNTLRHYKLNFLQNPFRSYIQPALINVQNRIRIGLNIDVSLRTGLIGLKPGTGLIGSTHFKFINSNTNRHAADSIITCYPCGRIGMFRGGQLDTAVSGIGVIRKNLTNTATPVLFMKRCSGRCTGSQFGNILKPRLEYRIGINHFRLGSILGLDDRNIIDVQLAGVRASQMPWNTDEDIQCSDAGSGIGGFLIQSEDILRLSPLTADHNIAVGPVCYAGNISLNLIVTLGRSALEVNCKGILRAMFHPVIDRLGHYIPQLSSVHAAGIDGIRSQLDADIAILGAAQCRLYQYPAILCGDRPAFCGCCAVPAGCAACNRVLTGNFSGYTCPGLEAFRHDHIGIGCYGSCRNTTKHQIANHDHCQKQRQESFACFHVSGTLLNI